MLLNILMSFREQEIFRENLLEPSLLIGQSLTVNDDHPSESSSDTDRVICTVMASTDAPESFSATCNAVPLFELRLGISNHSNALTCASKCGKRLRLKIRDTYDSKQTCCHRNTTSVG